MALPFLICSETLLNPADLVVDVLELQSATNQVNGSSDTSDLRFVLKKTGKVSSIQPKPSHRQSGRIAPAPISQQLPIKDTQSPMNTPIRRLSANIDASSTTLSNSQGARDKNLNDLSKNVISKLDVALTNLEKDGVDTASGRLKSNQLLRHPTFPMYQSQQRLPLSTTGSDSNILTDSLKPHQADSFDKVLKSHSQ
jgi:hypothetical protein